MIRALTNRLNYFDKQIRDLRRRLNRLARTANVANDTANTAADNILNDVTPLIAESIYLDTGGLMFDDDTGEVLTDD